MHPGKSSRELGLGGAALAAVGALMLPGMASGATLLLDFGNGAAYDGINSPAHVEGTVPASNTAWQKISSSAGGGNGLTVKDSDDNDVVVYLGRSGSSTAGTLDTADLNQNVYSVSSGTGVDIFNTDLTNDALASYTGTTYRDPIGALITGLPTGEYYVYIVGHFGGNANVETGVTDTGNADTGFNVFTGASSIAGPDSGSSTDLGNVYGLDFANALTGGNSTEWVNGINYAKFTIALTNDNPNLIVAADGEADTRQTNSYLTAVMITPVPEPGAVGLLAGAGLLALRRRRGIR